MLCPLTVADVPAFTEACTYERVFGSRALTALRAYGLGSSEVQFYVCMRGRTPCAALSLSGGVLTISSDPHADAAVIAELARREGVQEIDTNWSQCQALQNLLGGRVESSYYMVYRGAPVEEEFSDIVPGELGAVFDVLQQSHEYYRTHLSYNGWSADVSRKRARGLMEMYQLIRDGKVVGTGSILSEDDDCGVIGAIAVVPEWRGKGLGSRISRFLTGRVLRRGKTPRLISGYDEVAELYRKIGYTPCGRWGELYL